MAFHGGPRGRVAGWPAGRGDPRGGGFAGTASLLEAFTRVHCGAGCLRFAGPGSTFARPRPGLRGVPRREVASSGTSRTVQVRDPQVHVLPAQSLAGSIFALVSKTTVWDGQKSGSHACYAPCAAHRTRSRCGNPCLVGS